MAAQAALGELTFESEAAERLRGELRAAGRQLAEARAASEAAAGAAEAAAAARRGAEEALEAARAEARQADARQVAAAVRPPPAAVRLLLGSGDLSHSFWLSCLRNDKPTLNTVKTTHYD